MDSSQVPRPLQPPQVAVWQPTPRQPNEHLQVPDSQVPWPEQALGLPGTPLGQLFVLQSLPCHMGSSKGSGWRPVHVHLVSSQMPWPEHCCPPIHPGQGSCSQLSPE
jgi:hypothetical protein